MAQQLLIVTGDKTLDARLLEFGPKTRKKFFRSALRKSSRIVLGKFQKHVRNEAYNTGAYLESAQIRAAKVKRGSGQFGVAIHVDRNKFFALYRERYGKQPTPRSSDTDPMYVPAAIEFGYITITGAVVPPKRLQRRALYDSEQEVHSWFKRDLREVIAKAARK